MNDNKFEEFKTRWQDEILRQYGEDTELEMHCRDTFVMITASGTFVIATQEKDITDPLQPTVDRAIAAAEIALLELKEMGAP